MEYLLINYKRNKLVLMLVLSFIFFLYLVGVEGFFFVCVNEFLFVDVNMFLNLLNFFGYDMFFICCCLINFFINCILI